jgi:hypothetical protein
MRTTVLVISLALWGCASDCGPDWYQIGERDGRINAGSQIASYSARCSPPPDQARYEEGYRAGFARRPIPTW